MTEKIYYQDVETNTAVAKVLASGTDENGNYALLDRSCFYPEGGGQPADKGVIGEVPVMDVQVMEHEIRHYTEQLLEEGEYTIAIDWQRRFDHMQQHTGQHLLSAVFEDTLGMVTKSFHLGTERVSIDLDCPSINDEQLKKVEQQVNALIYKQIPIETEWVTQEQAIQMKLRKKPVVEGEIRLVKIADIDINACGGTHLRNTAELGLVKIIRTEKAKSGTRVYFLCGNRAMNHFTLLQSVTDQLTKSLNAPAAELPEAAAFILNDRKEKEKQLKKLALQILELEAEIMLPAGNSMVKDFNGRPFHEILQLAKLVAAKNPSLYLLFFVPEGLDVRLICAKGKNAAGDMKEVLAEIIEKNGKVGGNKELAQTKVILDEEPANYIKAFHESIKNIT